MPTEPPIQVAFPGFAIEREDVVVDVGCGEGVVCAYAGSQGADVIGIDIDAAWIALADKAMQGIPARSWRGLVSDCNPIPLPDATATVVVATEVLEHVDDPAPILSELVRIARPGARFLLSVPDPSSESLLRLVAPAWYWQCPFHQRVFERSQFEQLARSAGLEIQGTGASGFYWSIWWLLRMAGGLEPNQLPTDPAPLEHWQAAWQALMAHPRGRQVAEELDCVLPKSQLIYATKPVNAAMASSFRGPVFSRSRWRQRLRDGCLRLGAFDVRWKVRRVRDR